MYPTLSALVHNPRQKEYEWTFRKHDYMIKKDYFVVVYIRRFIRTTNFDYRSPLVSKGPLLSLIDPRPSGKPLNVTGPNIH